MMNDLSTETLTKIIRVLENPALTALEAVFGAIRVALLDVAKIELAEKKHR